MEYSCAVSSVHNSTSIPKHAQPPRILEWKWFGFHLLETLWQTGSCLGTQLPLICHFQSCVQSSRLRFTTSVQLAAHCLAHTRGGVILEESHSALKATTMYVQLSAKLCIMSISTAFPPLKYSSNIPLTFIADKVGNTWI